MSYTNGYWTNFGWVYDSEGGNGGVFIPPNVAKYDLPEVTNALVRATGEDAIIGNSALTVDNSGNLSGLKSIVLADSTVMTMPTSGATGVNYLGTTGSGGTLSFLTGTGGSGNISGPGSSTDSDIVLWNGTTGTIVKNSVVNVNTVGTITTPAYFTGTSTATQVVNLSTNTTAPFDSGYAVALQAPTGMGKSYNLIYPSTQGASGTTFINNGSGSLSWAPAGPSLPSATTNTAIALWGNTSGTALTNSPVLIDGSGDIQTPGNVEITSTGGNLSWNQDTYILRNSAGEIQLETGDGNIDLTGIRYGTAYINNLNMQDTALTGAHISVNNGGLRLQNTTYYVDLLTSSSQTVSYPLTLPTAQGSSGQVFTNTDGSGTLGWITPAPTYSAGNVTSSTPTNWNGSALVFSYAKNGVSITLTTIGGVGVMQSTNTISCILTGIPPPFGGYTNLTQVICIAETETPASGYMWVGTDGSGNTELTFLSYATTNGTFGIGANVVINPFTINYLID